MKVQISPVHSGAGGCDEKERWLRLLVAARWMADHPDVVCLWETRFMSDDELLGAFHWNKYYQARQLGLINPEVLAYHLTMRLLFDSE